MAPQGAHVSFAIAKVGSFSETTKFLPYFLVCFAFFGSHFILSAGLCEEKAQRSDPDGIQTHDLQNRNLTLYSAKLRSLTPCKNTAFLRLDQTILSFHPFALQWLLRFRSCACNTYDLPPIRSELPTKNSHVFQKISHVFKKISYVFWKISHIFCQTSEINLGLTSLSFSMLHAGVTTTANNRQQRSANKSKNALLARTRARTYRDFALFAFTTFTDFLTTPSSTRKKALLSHIF